MFILPRLNLACAGILFFCPMMLGAVASSSPATVHAYNAYRYFNESRCVVESLCKKGSAGLRNGSHWLDRNKIYTSLSLLALLPLAHVNAQIGGSSVGDAEFIDVGASSTGMFSSQQLSSNELAQTWAVVGPVVGGVVGIATIAWGLAKAGLIRGTKRWDARQKRENIPAYRIANVVRNQLDLSVWDFESDDGVEFVKTIGALIAQCAEGTPPEKIAQAIAQALRAEGVVYTTRLTSNCCLKERLLAYETINEKKDTIIEKIKSYLDKWAAEEAAIAQSKTQCMAVKIEMAEVKQGDVGKTLDTVVVTPESEVLWRAQSIKLDESVPQADGHLENGFTYFEQKKYKEALEELKLAEALADEPFVLPSDSFACVRTLCSASNWDHQSTALLRLYIGRIYLEGYMPSENGDLVTNFAIAREYFQKVVNQNDAPIAQAAANFYLGVIYYLGSKQDNMSKDYATAKDFFLTTERTEVSDPIQAQAQLYLGVIYFEGGYGMQADHTLARDYLNKALNNSAASEVVKIEARRFLGRLCYVEQKDKEAHDYFQSIVEQNVSPAAQEEAKRFLGHMYLDGNAVVQQDSSLAKEYFSQVTTAMSALVQADAQLHLGCINLKKQENDAAINFRHAATQNYDFEAKVSAQLYLGIIDWEKQNKNMAKNRFELASKETNCSQLLRGLALGFSEAAQRGIPLPSLEPRFDVFKTDLKLLGIHVVAPAGPLA